MHRPVYEGEIAQARREAHSRHMAWLACRLRRLSLADLRRSLLRYEQMRMTAEAQACRDEWSRRRPKVAAALARAAAEYERRRQINDAVSRDRTMYYGALKADLAGRDLAGVEHELMMYERLGWAQTALACRMELERRREKEGVTPS